MKKFAVALVSALALSALSAGAANAACPGAAPSGKNTTGSAPLPGTLEISVENLSIYGSVLGGFGESDLGTSGTNVTYSGELNGLVGYGELENTSVGTGGVSGSADGQAAGLSGDGSLSGGSLSVEASSPVLIIPCTTIP